MKNSALLVFILILITAFNQPETRYTQQSPEIETYKQAIEAYNNRDWDKLQTFYADTALITNNVPESEGVSASQMIQVNKEDATQFSSWTFVDDPAEYEMIVTDAGETWVNFWGIWEGTLNANEKKYVIPAHITVRFEDGKIVREFGYWNVSEITTDLRSLEEAEALALRKTEGEAALSSEQ